MRRPESGEARPARPKGVTIPIKKVAPSRQLLKQGKALEPLAKEKDIILKFLATKAIMAQEQTIWLHLKQRKHLMDHKTMKELLRSMVNDGLLVAYGAMSFGLAFKGKSK